MGECEQVDHEPRSLPLGQTLDQELERPSVSLAREEPVAVDQVHQRHGLLAQGVDDVVVAHHLVVLALAVGPAARRGHERPS